MSQIKIHLILSTFFLFFLEIHAQNEFLEDSKKLIEQYEESNTEAEKIALLYKLIPQLLSENSSDASKYIDIFSSFVKRDWDKVNYYIYQGSLLLEAGKIDSSLQKFYQAESISRKLKDDKLLSRTLYNISEAYWQKFLLDSAVLSLKKAIEIDLNSGDSSQLSKLYSRMAYHTRKKGNFSEALKLLYDALMIAKNKNDQYWIMRCYTDLGLIYKVYLDDYERSLEYGLKALEIAEELGNEVAIADFCNNIGNTYLFLDRIEEAEEVFLRAIDLYKKNNKESEMVNTIINYGSIFGIRGDLESAIDEFKIAYQISKDHEDTQGEMNYLDMFANYHLTMGKMKKDRGEKAKEEFRKADTYGLELLSIAKKVGVDTARYYYYKILIKFFSHG